MSHDPRSSTPRDPGALAKLLPWQRELVQSIATPQHRDLVLLLCRDGRMSCSVLERRADVRSVTSRCSEMIAAGIPIAKSKGHEPRRDGTLRPATFYEVTGPSPQRSLFDAT
jgi:hypothetical protein